MIVKNAMGILTRNHYVDKDDLLKCLNSGSTNLLHCAAQSWRYLKNTVKSDSVLVSDSRTILDFMEDVKGKENVAEAFVGRCFRFTCNDLRTSSERKEYFSAFAKFLDQYGKFIFGLAMINWDCVGGETIFYNNLFQKLPNIQYFWESPICYGNTRTLAIYLDDFNKRTCDPLYFLFVEYPINSILKMIGSSSHICSLDYEVVANHCGFEMKKMLSNIKILLLRIRSFNYADYLKFLDADLSSLRGIKKLILDGSYHHLASLAMLAHSEFQQIPEVSLRCSFFIATSEPINKPLASKYISVRKFTLQILHGAPPSLDEILDALPSLRYFRFRAKSQKSELINLFRKWQDEGNFENHTIDFYELYAQEISLSRSNIWRHLDNLNTLIVETVVEYMEWERFPGDMFSRGAYTKMNEIYTRQQGTISTMQEIILSDGMN